MRYSLKRSNGTFVKIPGTSINIGWKKKSHAEYYIQEHFDLYGGLEWRVGGLFKARRDEILEVVHTKDGSGVNWFDVKPEAYDY